MILAVLIAGLALNTWLLIIIYRQNVRKQLPWFAVYVAWEFLLACLQLTTWLVNSHFYVTVYWWTEAVEVVFMVGAVRESFLRIFTGFTAMRWFRWSVWAVITGVVLYSAWKAIYVPPVQSSRIVVFLIGAEFTFRWGIAAIAFLSMALMWFVQEPMGSREDAVVTGCGLISVLTVGAVLSRSFFGTRFIFLTQYLPVVGYFVAALYWIRVFSRPVEEFGFKELGMGPEDIAKELRRYRELGERIMRKK